MSGQGAAVASLHVPCPRIFTLDTRTINDHYHQFLISCKQLPVISYGTTIMDPLQFIQAPGHKVAKPYAQYNITVHIM